MLTCPQVFFKNKDTVRAIAVEVSPLKIIFKIIHSTRNKDTSSSSWPYYEQEATY